MNTQPIGSETKRTSASLPVVVAPSLPAYTWEANIKVDSLHRLYLHQLRGLHTTELQILDALPILAEAASSVELRMAFEDHLKETRSHLARMKSTCARLSVNTSGKKSPALEALLEDVRGLPALDVRAVVNDAAIIAAALKLDHYKIAGYASTLALARTVGDKDAADLLRYTLDEETRFDGHLTHLTEHVIAAASSPVTSTPVSTARRSR